MNETQSLLLVASVSSCMLLVMSLTGLWLIRKLRVVTDWAVEEIEARDDQIEALDDAYDQSIDDWDEHDQQHFAQLEAMEKDKRELQRQFDMLVDSSNQLLGHNQKVIDLATSRGRELDQAAIRIDELKAAHYLLAEQYQARGVVIDELYNTTAVLRNRLAGIQVSASPDPT